MENSSFLQKLLDFVASLIKKQADSPQGISASISFPLVEAPKEQPKPEIDWSNPNAKISARFTVKEALLLQSWGVMHVPSEDEKKAILAIAEKVEKAADIVAQKLGVKALVSVHAWIRPGKANCPGSKWNGYDYNRYVYVTQVFKGLTQEEISKKHIPESPHKTGHAVDFHIVGFEGPEGCAKIRAVLLPELEALGIRMEDRDGGWVHLDDLPVIHSRFFKP